MGGSRHWIILMSDLLVHSGYSSFSSHPLKTVWIESHGGAGGGSGGGSSSGDAGGGSDHHDADHQKHEIVLTMPEDTLTLLATTAEAKQEWFGALQRSILEALRSDRKGDDAKLLAFTTPPITRRTRYRFRRGVPAGGGSGAAASSDLKGAEYDGTWMQGKMHGYGIITWPDGRVYRGQIRQNQKHG